MKRPVLVETYEDISFRVLYECSRSETTASQTREAKDRSLTRSNKTGRSRGGLRRMRTRSLVGDARCVRRMFYREKTLIRHVLTAGAVGCENPLSSRISSRSECAPLFIYFCTLIWGAL